MNFGPFMNPINFFIAFQCCKEGFDICDASSFVAYAILGDTFPTEYMILPTSERNVFWSSIGSPSGVFIIVVFAVAGTNSSETGCLLPNSLSLYCSTTLLTICGSRSS